MGIEFNVLICSSKINFHVSTIVGRYFFFFGFFVFATPETKKIVAEKISSAVKDENSPA